MEQNTIAERIIAVRGRDSRAEFAARIHINAGTLRNYEGGLSLPNADVLARVCRVCSINPRWLLLGEGRMHGERRAGAAPDAGNATERAAVPEQLRALQERIAIQKDAIEAQKKTIQTYEAILAATLQSDADEPLPPLSARRQEILREHFQEIVSLRRSTPRK